MTSFQEIAATPEESAGPNPYITPHSHPCNHHTLQEIAATPEDSELRFVSRKLWPAFAKTLREAGPAAPIVAALISGGDKEATLSEEYGGVAGAQPGVGAWMGDMGGVQDGEGGGAFFSEPLSGCGCT